MKLLLYNFFKGLIRAGFYCYFREIRMNNIERVPTDRAVMLLPNHQNALLDPLLYAAFARAKKPYFLTRSDVFGNPLLRWIFKGLRMMPIYRLRDGRETLPRNQEVFDRCADLFSKREHILLFPEANHNLRRQVRPLSKGFTRILSHSFQKYPDLDIWIVPVGVNYQQAAKFPDRVAFYFGEPFSARSFCSGALQELDITSLRQRVFHALTALTIHIPPELDYDVGIQNLYHSGEDFLNPDQAHRILSKTDNLPHVSGAGANRIELAAWDTVFHILNLPVWLLWRWIATNKVPETEFMSTFRFLYSLLAIPLYYIVGGLLLSVWFPNSLAFAAGVVLFLFNLAYVKLRPLRLEF